MLRSLTQGKGLRAFLNTVLALVVQETLNEYNMFKQLGYSEKYKSDGVELHIRNSRYPKMIGGFSRYNEYQFTEFYNFDRYLFSHIAPEIKQIDVDEENK